MSYKFIERMPTSTEWAEIRSAISWSIETEEDFDIAAKNTLYAISVFDSNKIIGMGRIVGDNKICFYIQDIVVIPKYQKQGIGTHIMYLILTYISLNASPNASIGLFAALNKENFYEKFGFISRPNKEKGCGMYIHHSTVINLVNQYPNCIML